MSLTCPIELERKNALNKRYENGELDKIRIYLSDSPWLRITTKLFGYTPCD